MTSVFWNISRSCVIFLDKGHVNSKKKLLEETIENSLKGNLIIRLLEKGFDTLMNLKKNRFNLSEKMDVTILMKVELLGNKLFSSSDV